MGPGITAGPGRTGRIWPGREGVGRGSRWGNHRSTRHRDGDTQGAPLADQPPPSGTGSSAPPSVVVNKPSHIFLSSHITFFQWQKIIADKWQLISSHYFEAIILKWETMLPGKSPITELNTKPPRRQMGRPICTAQKLTKSPSLEVAVNYRLKIFKDNFHFNPRGRGQAGVQQVPS